MCTSGYRLRKQQPVMLLFKLLEIFMTIVKNKSFTLRFGALRVALLAALGMAFFLLIGCGGGGGNDGGGNISVVTPIGIEITTAPKDVYRAGFPFEPKGMVLTVHYSNGSSRNVPYVGNETLISIEGNLNNLSVGNHILTVRYQGFTTNLPIQIIPANSSVENVVVAQAPNRTEYVVRNTFDWRGMVVQANYVWDDDGSPAHSETFNAFPEYGLGPDWDYHLYDKGTQTPSSMDDEGVKDVLISYMNIKTKEPFEITIRIPEGAQRLAVENTKENYFTGDAFDPESITITAYDYLDNPTNIELNDPKLRISIEGLGDITIANPPVFTNPGTALVTVYYEEVDDSFTVNVTQLAISTISIKTEPTKTVYEFDEDIDLSGLELEAVYNNGDTRIIQYDVLHDNLFSLNPSFNGKIHGTQIFKVFYGESETENTFTVTVKEYVGTPYTTGISAEFIENVVYYVGDYFQPSSVSVTNHVNTGDRPVLPHELWFSIDDGVPFGYTNPKAFTTAGESTIQISWTDAANNVHPCIIQVQVLETAVTRISLKTAPTTVQYMVGDSLDLSGLSIMTHYNNPAKADGEIVWSSTSGVDVTPMPDLGNPGTYNVRFTYSGFTTPETVMITVNAHPPSTVRFDVGEGSDAVIAPQYIDRGGHITTLPEAPRANNYPFPASGLFEGGDYIFTGWYELGESTPFDFANTPINGDITLTAQWKMPEQVTNINPNFTTSLTNSSDVAAATPGNNNSIQMDNVLAHVNLPAHAGKDFVLVVNAPTAATQVIFISGNNYTRNVSGHLELRGATGAPVQRFRLSTNGAMFNVTGNNGVLTLGKGITLQGRHNSGGITTAISTLPARADNTHPLIRATTGGMLYMDNGAVIQGNRPLAGNTLGNRGGGVHVADGGRFVMRGGSISNNGIADFGANRGGAVFIATGGIFEMRGGELTSNRASLSAIGGAIANVGGTFRISHGWIPGNERTDTLKNDRNSGSGGVLHHSDNATSAWGTFDEVGDFTQAGTFFTGTGVQNRDPGILIVNGQPLTTPVNGRPAGFPAP